MSLTLLFLKGAEGSLSRIGVKQQIKEGPEEVQTTQGYVAAAVVLPCDTRHTSPGLTVPVMKKLRPSCSSLGFGSRTWVTNCLFQSLKVVVIKKPEYALCDRALSMTFVLGKSLSSGSKDTPLFLWKVPNHMQSSKPFSCFGGAAPFQVRPIILKYSKN